MNSEPKKSPEQDPEDDRIEPQGPSMGIPEEPSVGASAQDTPTHEADQAPEGAEHRAQQLEAEAAELRDKLLRAMAETENVRRRTERDLADARKYGASSLAKDMFNVADNLRRALESVGGDKQHMDEATRNLVTGVEMVERDLLAGFEKAGITKLVPQGEAFDHSRHQAMYEAENTGQPAGTVVEVLQPGYLLHDRLLRPAMVVVAKGDSGRPPDIEHVDTTA